MSDIEIGHNNPPEVLELSSAVIASISSHMADNPVVETEEAARGMKVQIDRAKHAIKDLEAELAGKVRPFLAAEEMIREDYRPKRRMLGDLLDEMLARLQIFVSKEQDRREQEAAKLAALAQEARLRALEAERIEMEKLDDASKGEIGVNVAEVIQQADQAFETYQKAERQATVAQKETHVKIGGGFGRAIGMRKKETLVITRANAAIAAMGVTDDIRDAILKSARAYRTVHGKLPEGIISQVEEHL
jgi:hypothetical protein